MMRKIKKVHLHQDGKVDVQFDELLDDNGRKDKNGKESDDIAHQDLINAFRDLNIHLAAKCEQANYTDLEDDPKLLEQFMVTQFTVGGDGDHEGIVLTGQRKLSTNEILNLNTPFIKFHKDHCNYIYIASLQATLQQLLSEVDQYIEKTKLAPKAQMEISFDKDNDNHEEQPEKKVSRKKKEKVEEAA